MLFLLAFNLSGYSQQIAVKEVITKQYPLIQIVVEAMDGQVLNEQNILLSELDIAVPFRISNIREKNNDKTICFLIESAFENDSLYYQTIQSAIENAFNLFAENDQLAICFFGAKSESDSYLQHLNIEFTNDYELLKKSLLGNNCFFKEKNLSVSYVDALLENIAFVYRKDASSNQKMIIHIGRNFSSTIKQQEKLHENLQVSEIKIQSFIIGELDSLKIIDVEKNSKDTNRQSEIVGLDDLSRKLNQTILELTEKQTEQATNKYLIRYTTVQNSLYNPFILTYNSERYQSAFTWKNETSLEYIVIIVFLIFFIFTTLVSIFFLIRAKLKNIETEQEVPVMPIFDKQNKYSPQPIREDDFDPARTFIGSGGALPYLKVLSGYEKKRIELTKITMSVGRDKSNDIVLVDTTISSLHATIINEGGVFYIQDNDSTNGTFLNDLRISKKVRIEKNDVIRLGIINLKMRF